MSFIDDIKAKARNDLKTIILPESMDKRVLEAAGIVAREGIARVIVIGEVDKIKELDSNFDFDLIKVIDPRTYEETDDIINELVSIRKDKGLTYDEARELILNDYMYFSCMLVKIGYADGIVSGACHSTANTLRPALQIIKTKPNTPFVSTFFIMCVPDCSLGQNPTSLELAEIAKSTADSFKLLTGNETKVAMISHSTKGSAKHEDVTKVVEACRIAKEKYPQYNIDGELQVDAAIVPEVARIKAPDSLVAGKANVLIFPDLDAGNSGYKLVQRLAKALAYGPMCQGIASPINDLSRGCSVDDIVGVVAITAVQAQNN